MTSEGLVGGLYSNVLFTYVLFEIHTWISI